MIWRFRHTPHAIRTQQGMTLLELLVVLAIVSLALIVVAPNLSGSSDRASLERTARQIASNLRHTRATSIRRNESLAFTLNLAEKSFTAGAGTSETSYPNDIEIRAVVARGETLDDAKPAIRFWPDGSSTGGEIELSRNGRTFQVQVDWLTGSVDFSRLDDETG